MTFKSDQVRFVEIDASLDAQASREVASAMNSATFDDGGGFDPFASAGFDNQM